VLNAVEQLGIQNPGVVDQTSSGPTGTVHNIVVSGYVPTDDHGSPRVPRAHDQILTLVRDNMPLDGVDAIVVSLRSGINLGIYRSYETTNRVEPASSQQRIEVVAAGRRIT
jgi:hypothetical protein